MRKCLMTVLALVFGVVFANANPVDQAKAKQFGQQFVQANFDQIRGVANLDLVYTITSDAGVPCLYVFNVDDYGFVIVSASDCVRPILGYSYESTFDAENINPELDYYLGVYKASITHAIENIQVAEPWVAAEWNSLQNCGKLKDSKGSSVAPLVAVKWNQGWPYNKYCPEQSASWADHGHVVVGCVATAMAQIMKYWDHPVQGQGSHSYYAYLYGQQSANFGATTYDWANMPISINANSPEAQIDAVAILSYHCGVAVDMQYDTDGTGSGAVSNTVPGAMSNYFRYAPSTFIARQSYTLEVWNGKLKEAFDMGRPVYYSGRSSQGGHAFVCDGYDENDLFHFNWGWGGSGNGYFACDAIDYSTDQGAIMNLMPLDVYNNTAQAPTNLTVTPTSDVALSATVSWKNPTKTMNNSNLTTIDQVIVTRNGKIAHIENNTQPGATITITDDNVPCFGSYEYKVYAVVNNIQGYSCSVKDISFGPTCQWKAITSTTSFQGWKGGCVTVYNSANHVVATITTTNSSTNTVNIDMPIGTLRFAWTPGSAAVNSMGLIIKDYSGQTIYNFSGASTDLPEGIFLELNNSCGNNVPNNAPSRLFATGNDDSVTLNWTGVSDTGYGYIIYRNNIAYQLVQETSFVDTDVTVGGYCYTVKVLGEGGESEPTNEACATVGEGCNAPRNIWYEPVGGKPKITWEKPEPADGLSGFYVYKRTADTDWELAKLVNANTTSYTDSKPMDDGTWYYYKVQAYYGAIECTSAPANARHNNLEYFVKVLYPCYEGVDENVENNAVLYPNPTSGKLNVEAEGMEMVSVFNLLGQKVTEISVNANQTEIDLSGFESGIYMVRIIGSDYEITKRVSVVK